MSLNEAEIAALNRPEPMLEPMLEAEEGTGPMKNGRYFPYDDATGKRVPTGGSLVGKLTIGTGRNLTDRGISEEEKDLMLRNDMADNERECLAIFPWFSGLDVPRYTAFLDICFNLGAANFKAKWPNTCKAIEQQHWGAVASALRGSLWARQVGDRATKLIQIIETGGF